MTTFLEPLSDPSLDMIMCCVKIMGSNVIENLIKDNRKNNQTPNKPHMTSANVKCEFKLDNSMKTTYCHVF